jgi:hypothetical protein
VNDAALILTPLLTIAACRSIAPAQGVAARRSAVVPGLIDPPLLATRCRCGAPGSGHEHSELPAERG